MTAIGVFDSGVGGLTVVAALKRRLPDEAILFLGDTARLPYGTKSAATVIGYSRRNVALLESRGVKAIVVACNTASALALESIGTELPLWGVVEPGAERAAALATRHVAVLATESTVRSDAYARALRRRRGDLEITSISCPLFVPLVEEGWQEDPIAEAVARRYLEPLLVPGAAPPVDTVVLACTHYPLLRPVLERVMGGGVTFVDSAEVTARQVADGLDPLGLRQSSAPGADRYLLTDNTERFERIAATILGRDDLCLEHVDL